MEGGKRVRIYHKAKLIDRKGRISPVCADPPKAINLKKETWTLRWEAVTCPKCLEKKDME
jgi:hypothetical protein